MCNSMRRCATVRNGDDDNASHATAPARAKTGVNDGTRTHDDRIHNPGLYQLSYAHRNLCELYT